MGVGRQVIYQSFGTPNGEYNPENRAAIVTQICEPEASDNDEKDGHPYVGLVIFNPSGLYFNPKVPYSKEPKPGHWSWS